MEIHFCDLCNESVPQSDLDIGRAFMRKGRVVCATCDSLMSAREAEALAARGANASATHGGHATASATVAPHLAPVMHAHPPQTASSGSGIALAAAALGIVLTLVLGYWAGDQFKQIRGGFDARAAELDAAQHRARLDADNATARLAREVATVGRSVADGDAEQRNWVDGKLREGTEQLRTAATQINGLQARIDEQKVALEHLTQRDAQVTALEQRVAEIADELKQMNTRIELALQAAASAAAGVNKQPAVSPENRPAWLGLVEQLKSPSQSDRWQAVNALGETRDPAAAPYLIPLLQDKDLFVRMTTARSLGDLGSPLAVSPLIATLGDAASPVREAAYLALRAITKRDLPFDPQSEDSVERNKRIHAWEEWWKKENGA